MTQDWDAGRLDSDLEGAAFDTLAVRAGQRRTPEGEHGEALFTTSSYVFRTAADAAARFAGEVPGNVYSRYTNPTVRTFEERIAALEGAEQAVATASGMSAILALVMSLCSSGDHVLVSRSVFGSTISLFDKYFKRFGIQVDYPPLSDLAAWEAACKPNTKLFFVESPSNPLAELVDIAALAEIAHANGALLAVDNCFCTPALQQPLKLGADVVIHSATKYIDGQGRGMGGGRRSRRADEGSGRLSPHRRTDPQPVQRLAVPQGPGNPAYPHAGAQRQCPGPGRMAGAPAGHRAGPYAGLQSHPQHELARRQQSGFGAVVSFDVKGGRDAAWRFIDATRMVSITTNLGDTKTTIAHPATTSHGRLSPRTARAPGSATA